MIYVDKNINMPYYMQIYKKVRENILSGQMKPGFILPGSRRLAEELGIGRNTVNNAYAQLAAEGYIDPKAGIGYVVGNVTDMDFSIVSNQAAQARPKAPEYEEKDESHILYDLLYGALPDQFFPAALWKKYTAEALSPEIIPMITQYPDKKGYLNLRRQLATYLHHMRGVRCSEAQVIITCGLQQSLDYICKLIYQNSGTIAAEEPCYDKARYVFTNNNLTVEPLIVDANGAALPHYETQKNVSAVYITPSHQYPTGVTMPIRRRYEFLQWATESNGYIIEDDYDSEFRYDANPVPSLQSIDQDDRVIYIGTFSKSLAPSMRMGYMVLPKHLLTMYADRLGEYHCPAPWLNQYIVCKLIENGHYERLTRKLCNYIKKRHDLFLRELSSAFHAEYQIYGHGAGQYLIIEFSKEKKEEWLIAQAEKYGVKVYPAHQFWQNPSRYNGSAVSLGFSRIDLESIPDCVARLKKAWLDH